MVWDPSGGAVTNGSQFVSSYAELNTLTGTQNGVVNSSSSGWSNLRVLVDTGSGPGQLYTLAQLGITSINTNATGGPVSNNGNFIGQTSTFTTVGGGTGQIADVAFATAHNSTTKPVTMAAPSNTLQNKVGAMVRTMASFNAEPTVADSTPKLKTDLTSSTLSPTVHVTTNVSSMVNVLNQYDSQGQLAVTGSIGVGVPTKLNINDPLKDHHLAGTLTTGKS